MRCRRSVALLALLALTAALVSGCAAARPTPEPQPLPAEQPAPPGGDAAGTRLAYGIYDMPDGTVQAVGTLDYSDIEGGFWQVIGGTEAEGNAGQVIAVIANGSDFESELKPLSGKSVLVTGKRSDGASIRMAGPEIVMDKVTEMSDTGGPAE